VTLTPHAPDYGGGGLIGTKVYLVEWLGAMDIYDLATHTWTTGPRRPFRLCEPASITYQAKLYLAGCHADDDNDNVYPMLVLDPASASWAQATAPPSAVDPGHWATFSRVVVNGKTRLQLVGGESPNNNLQYSP
jgi:hypothetical protein